jgi:hypothetical protein
MQNPSIQSLPVFINGLVLLDIKFYKDTGKTKMESHVIVTCRGDGIFEFVRMTKRGCGEFRRVISVTREHKFIEEATVYEVIAKTVASWVKNAVYVEDYAVIHYEHFHYSKAIFDRLTQPVSQGLWQFLTRYETPVVYVGFTREHAPGLCGSDGYMKATDVAGDVLVPVMEEPVHVRLSKEDWLKANYPELKELPKWRFPSVAG